jgi:competence protein ComEA
VPDTRHRAAALAARARPAPEPWSPLAPVAARSGTEPDDSFEPEPGPTPDADRDGDVEPTPDVDAEAVTARLRQGALEAVSAAYSSAHGHPLGLESDVDEPAGPRRWAVSLRTAALAIVALAALCAAVVTVAVAHGAGHAVPLPAASTAVDLPAPVGTSGTGPRTAPVGAAGSSTGGSSTADPATGASAVSTTSVVDVVGAVRKPGVVHLPPGARVADAITAAGGANARADLDQVNLARPVVDGEQLRVPRAGEVLASTPAPSGGSAPAPGPGSGTASGATTSGDGSPATGADTPVDLNTADANALDALPGVGPVIAQRIVDWRTQHGRFTSVDQLEEVSGIGPALLAKVRDRVRM